MIKSDKSFESIMDYLVKDVNDTVKDATLAGAGVAIGASLVDTGKFKANWHVSFDKVSNKDFERVDPEGDATFGLIQQEVSSFNILKNKSVYLVNNVQSELNYGYAPTVGWDATQFNANVIADLAERATDDVYRSR